MDALDIETYQELWLSMTVIDAEQQLLRIQAATYPNTSESNQKKIHREIRKLANPSFENEDNEKQVTTKELGLILVGSNGRQ